MHARGGSPDLRCVTTVTRLPIAGRQTGLADPLLTDNHPTLVINHTHLTALRDRDLLFDNRRMAREEIESERVYRAEIASVWEWWRNGREELQREMMAEVMRKRRRVDREKRAVEGGRREFSSRTCAMSWVASEF